MFVNLFEMVQHGLNDAVTTRCSGWGAVRQFSLRMRRPTGGPARGAPQEGLQEAQEADALQA